MMHLINKALPSGKIKTREQKIEDEAGKSAAGPSDGEAQKAVGLSDSETNNKEKEGAGQCNEPCMHFCSEDCTFYPRLPPHAKTNHIIAASTRPIKETR